MFDSELIDFKFSSLAPPGGDEKYSEKFAHVYSWRHFAQKNWK